MNPRIIVLALSTFAFGSGALIFSGLLEMLAADLGVSAGVAGQLQTAYVLTSAFAGPPLAFLVGRLERKTVLLAALALAIGLNVICMITRDFAHLLIFRAIVGATAALAGPAASSAAAALAPPEKRGAALAVVGGGMTVAFLMGIPMGSVVGSLFGWRSAFALAAGLAALAFVGIALFLPRVQPPPPALGGGLTLSRTAPMYMATFLAFGANMTITTYIAVVLRLQAGVVGAGVAAFQIMVGLGSLVGLTLGGRAADRDLGRMSVTVSFLGLATAAAMHGAALLHVLPAGWPTYVFVALTLFTGSVSLFSVMPVVQSRLITAAPNAAPLALALNGSSASCGQALGASIGGAVLGAFGGPGLPVAAAAIALCAAMIWWRAAKHAPQPVPA
ncbi:MAG: MFS transporter [Phenylobacterium sp.]|uniref:MFS transporter n=1 Tax=Phenylobacterium sp. TaxID=1871053 RepID=UPI0039197D51